MNGQIVYGQALFDAGQYDEASATFNTALGLDPENLIALRHLGDIARLTGHPAEAVQWYSRVLEADPRNEEIQEYLAEAKAAAAPAPPVAAAPAAVPAAPRAETPQGTDTIKVPAVPRPSLSNVTPIAPVETIPVKRPSVPLMDVDFDLGGMDTPVGGAQPVVPPDAPAATTQPAAAADTSLGDIEFTDMSFGSADEAGATGAAVTESGELAGAAPDAPPAADLQLESALGWDMGGNIDLDAGAPAAADDAGSATPEVFVTETMAELYLQQGFREEALQVYRQLAQMNPDDKSLVERIQALEGGGRSSMSFEKLADDVPEFAPGTSSLVPIDEVAEPAPDPDIDIELAAAAPAAPEPAVPESAAPEPAAPEPAAPEPAAPAEVPAPAVPAAAAPATAAASDAKRARKTTPATSARAFFAALAQRKPLKRDGTAPAGVAAVPEPPPESPARQPGSLDQLFGSAGSGGDDSIAEALATAVGAIEAPSAIRGRPTQVAASELSLDSVFRGEGAVRSAGGVERKSSMLKFDQFFESDAGAESAPAAPADAEPALSADDEKFKSWLDGLQGKGQ